MHRVVHKSTSPLLSSTVLQYSSAPFFLFLFLFLFPFFPSASFFRSRVVWSRAVIGGLSLILFSSSQTPDPSRSASSTTCSSRPSQFVSLPTKLLPGLIKVATTISDPEARSVVGRTCHRHA